MIDHVVQCVLLDTLNIIMSQNTIPAVSSPSVQVVVVLPHNISVDIQEILPSYKDTKRYHWMSCRALQT